jgi:hypothetical protein
MDYAQLVKTLQLPPGCTASSALSSEDLVARAITRDDLSDDVRGINASIAALR